MNIAVTAAAGSGLHHIQPSGATMTASGGVFWFVEGPIGRTSGRW